MLRDLRPLFAYMRRYRWGYIWGTLAVLATNAISVQFPRVVGRTVDSLTHPSTTRNTILLYVGLILAIGVAKSIFLYAQRWVLIGISREIEYDLRNDLFRHLETMDTGFYRSYRTGDIMARMTNDLNAVRMLLGPAIMYSANTLLFSVGALYYLLRVSPQLTLIAILPAPLASVLVQYLGRKIHDRFEKIQEGFSEISSQAQENYSANRLVRAFAQEEAQMEQFEKLNRSYIARALRLVQLMGMLWPTLEFILGGSMILTLLAGGHEVITHRITVGQFVEFNTYMLLLIFPVIALGWVVNIFQRGTASVKRIDEMMRVQPSIDNRDADTSIPETAILRGEIEFRNLSYGYDDASSPHPVLDNVSLRIPAGSSFAIVGPTGSGKTTLVSTISRMLEAPNDTLYVDGRPVRQYPLSVLRHNIGMVPQETFLFSETLRENLTFGAPNATTEDMLHAAEAAHIRKEFEEFPQGFETIVGERGVTLSGGQKQRTAIARALLRRPSILILDDALASVDTYTEEQILGGLSNYSQNATTILISHRVSTVRNADQIAVLEKGRIVELGTHDELLAIDGYYASLFQKQQLEEELTIAS